MLSFIKETVSVWERLQQTTKPIVLYGMGNGADKIVDWCEDNTETFTIDPMACQFRSTWEDVEFEKKFYDIIFNSKYK